MLKEAMAEMIARTLSEEDYQRMREERDTIASTITAGGVAGGVLDIMGGGRTKQLLQDEFDENRQILAAYARLHRKEQADG